MGVPMPETAWKLSLTICSERNYFEECRLGTGLPSDRIFLPRQKIPGPKCLIPAVSAGVARGGARVLA
jgi:hypothetical protein